ncbi:hypothetical protein [Candidatus Oleimmundimicrobium sp.]|uniref:hypothetical protein n=1 Tax=Candidatus Oleimmundimicrobium sp. TaxID=3060597 RepID=UPI00272832D6|nr:hypothetical protein [Candidatus Oleimmundimicrobium sp.]MDO8886914.1 hypothetical protein [Candidatus Oleimmundimicrobium sp.]
MKVVALFSGGLDSILAVRLIQEQGIKVVGITFTTPFFGSKDAEVMAKKISLPLTVQDITDEHLKIVKNPKHGHGKNMNPCIDCHVLMAKKAGDFMRKKGASFIISGEVLGERPMSQNKAALRVVDKESGYDGYVLRPLSARLLSPTIPEEKGWVDREKLLSISGRSRKVQLELAKKYNLQNFPTPAGGCLLTDGSFSNRLRDLLELNLKPDVNDLELLKYGRHFPTKEALIIVSRNQDENNKLIELAKDDDLFFQVRDYPGPKTILRGKASEKAVEMAAHLTVKYGKAKNVARVEVWCWHPGKERKLMIVNIL